MTTLLNLLLFHGASLMTPGCGVVASAMLFSIFNGNYHYNTICVDGGYRLRADVLFYHVRQHDIFSLYAWFSYKMIHTVEPLLALMVAPNY